MIRTFFEGVALGITICFLIGPVFFTLLQTSIHRGFKSGVFLALGVSLSDLSLIIVSFLGATQILSSPTKQFYIGLIGGIILIIFGAYNIFKKHDYAKDSQQQPAEAPGPLTYIIKGYVMNIANPFLLIWWVGAMSLVTANYGESHQSIIVFFIGTIITVFATDLVKCFVANKLKQFLNPNILLWINRIVGVILIVSGIILLTRVCLSF